jgi:integrase
VSNLWWADVDWDGPALRIKGSVGIIAGQRVGGTMGGRERIVGLDAGTVDALRALRRKQVGNQMALGEAWSETGHVFTSGDGVPINPPQHAGAHGEDHPGTQCQYLAGCARFPWHNSTICGIVHATHLLLADVPVHVVAERLGHADPAITLRV